MNMLLFNEDHLNRYQRVSQSGAFKANQLCAATGIAYWQIIATREFTREANQKAGMIRTGA